MAAVQCRPCAREVNRPSLLVNVSTRAIFNKPCYPSAPFNWRVPGGANTRKGKGKGAKARVAQLQREIPGFHGHLLNGNVIREVLALLQ